VGRRVFRRSGFNNEEEHMFCGQYRHNLDNKGRLTIPARFRELLEGGAYVTQGFDKNLMVLSVPSFDFISQSVNQMSLTNSMARELRRLLFSTASRVEPDKNGRILLPQFLRDVAELNTEAVIVGVGNYFEIWSPAPWNEQITRLMDTDANAQRFAPLDLTSNQE
jgi:MraZ protein